MSRHELWTSFDGKTRSISALDDEHLANVLCHINHYPRNYTIETLTQVGTECLRRKLDSRFLQAAPYPFKWVEDGLWYIWDFKKNCVVRYQGKRF